MKTRHTLCLALLTALAGAASPRDVQAEALAGWSPADKRADGGAKAVERLPFYIRHARGRRGDVDALVRGQGGEITHDLKDFNTVAVMMPAPAASALAANPAVELIEPVPSYQLQGQVVPWNIDQFQARDIWDKDRDGNVDPGEPDGSGVKFCIIDTGFYYDIDGPGPDTGHDDFAGITASGISQIAGEQWHFDGNGHGTHVAGTANAVNNGIGVVGVMPGGAELYIVKIFNNSGVWVAGQSNLGAAAQACRDAGANVLSMSLGGGSSATEEAIFQSLYDNNNILNIAAAGNDGNNVASYPASYESVISVAAIDENRVAAEFTQTPNSAYGVPANTTPRPNTEWDVVEFAGGGVQVLSTVPAPNGAVPTYTATANGTTYNGAHIEGTAFGSPSAQLIAGGLCDTTNAAWNGRVVLCERGSVAFSAKVNNVRNSGGIATLIYNNLPGGFAGTCLDANDVNLCTQPSIPALSLSQADGQTLLASAINAATQVVADNGSSCTTCNGGYDYYSGTSMATPGVAAAVGFIWDSCGGPASVTNKQLRQLLRDSALDLTGTQAADPTVGGDTPIVYGAGWDRVTGWGLVQLKAALDLGNTRFGSTCPILLEVAPSQREICTAGTDSTTFGITLDNRFTGSATLSASGLPAGSSGAYSPNPIVHPTKLSTYTLSGLTGKSGTFTLQFNAVDNGAPGNAAQGFAVLDAYDAAPAATTLTAPANGAAAVALNPTLSWNAIADVDSYTVEVSTSPAFTTILASATVQSTSHTFAAPLAGNTTHYWRVRGNNPCGGGSNSATFSFTTVNLVCTTVASTDVPKAIADATNPGPTPGVTNSTLVVGATGTINDVNVVGLTGTHSWINDLTFDLISPAATTVRIMNQSCADENDFNLNLDDDVAAGAWPCPPTGGGTYRPSNPLSAFDGQAAAGTWTLRVRDVVRQDTGTLTGWGLRICSVPPAGNAAPVANADSIAVNEGGTATALVGGATSVRTNDTDAEDGTPTGNVTLIANAANGSLTLNANGTFSYTHNGGQTTSDSFTYRVADSNGTQSNIATVSIAVSGVNDAPAAVGTIAAQSGTENTAIAPLATAGNFTDADGDTLTYGATGLPPGLSIAPATGQITGTPTFAASGTHNVTVTATDPSSAFATQSFVWTIANTNRAPTVANVIADQSDVEGETINLDLSAVFTDADSDTLSLSLTGGTLPPGLSLAGNAITGTLSFASAGTYNGIAITASDGNGGTVVDAFNWTVTGTNQAPTVANAIADQSDAEGEAINLDLSAVFADADGDTLALSLAGGALPPGLSLVGNAITGTLTFASAGTYNGITITADDGNGGTISDTFSWTVTGTNQAPTVANAIADQNDAEGDAINLDLSAVFADADGDTLSLSLTGGSLPPGLSLVGNAITGTLPFASAGNYNGITITANDGNGGTVSDTFDWTVAATNQAPTVANAIADQNDVEGEAINLSLAATFADADGDGLTLTLAGGALPPGLSLAGNAITGTLTLASAGSYPGIVIQASDGNGGTVTDSFDWNVSATNQAPTVANAIADQNDVEGNVVNLDLSAVFADADGDTLALSLTGGSLPPGLSLVGNAVTGTLTFVSGGTYNGITITANDGNGGTISDTFSWTVTGTNRAPAVANAIADQNDAEGEVISLDLSAVFTDADGDTLALSLTGGPLPSGLSLVGNAITGTLTFASAGTYNGITVTANDGNGGTISDTFSWTVTGTNQAPTVANAIADQTDAEGAAVNLSLASVFADADGNPLTLSLTAGTLPPGLAFNGTAITGTLTFASAGTYNGITITANDGNGGTVSDTFSWTVANTNQAPAFTNEPYDFLTTEGAAAGTPIGTLTASDADAGAVLAYAITGGNTGSAFAIDPATGAITVATPAAVTIGTFTLTVSVSDGADSDTATVTITVEGGAPLPDFIFRDGFED